MRRLVLCAVLAGCYSPDIASGVPCGEGFACPSAQICDRGASPPICVRPGDEVSDAGAPDAGPPGAWSRPRPVMVPVGLEDDPTLTSDLLELVFNRDHETIWRVRRTRTTEAWGAPEQVFELGLATSPELTGDGRTVYLGSDRPGSVGAEDIWVSTRVALDAPWTFPVRVTELSSPMADSSAAPGPANLSIVFTRRISARRDVELMEARRASTSQPWSPPRLLSSLNTDFADGDPMLSADELTLYFYSLRRGKGDLFTATRPSLDEPFGEPQPIDELNTPDSLDQDPWISPDGRHIFFASDRSGQMTIYEATR